MEERIVALLSKAAAPMGNAQIVEALGVSRKGGGYVPEVDRALQRLRKSGRIHVVKGRWSVSALQPCKHCNGRGFVAA